MKTYDVSLEPFNNIEEWRYILEQKIAELTYEEKEALILYAAELKKKRTQSFS